MNESKHARLRQRPSRPERVEQFVERHERDGLDTPLPVLAGGKTTAPDHLLKMDVRQVGGLVARCAGPPIRDGAAIDSDLSCRLDGRRSRDQQRRKTR